MQQKTQRLLIGAGVLVGALLLTRRPKNDPDSVLDALTNMLLAETDFARDKQEMAQILFVALNRAKQHSSSVVDIVTPPGKPTWNSGATYRERFNSAEQSSRWAAARVFVQQVLTGAYGNQGYTSFLHPSGMPTPPCSGALVSSQTAAGARCLPSWAIGGRVVGGAMFV